MEYRASGRVIQSIRQGHQAVVVENPTQDTHTCDDNDDPRQRQTPIKSKRDTNMNVQVGVETNRILGRNLNN